MTELEKLSYVKALMYVALADDRIEESELQYLEQAANMYGLNNDQAVALKESVMRKDESIADILACVLRSDLRSSHCFMIYWRFATQTTSILLWKSNDCEKFVILWGSSARSWKIWRLSWKISWPFKRK